MRRLSSALVAGVVVLGLWATWTYLAPARIGGHTTYLVTAGVSMEPHFHTGDLAIVRPAGSYAVGEVAAYHSTLLHTVVLHRIVAIHDGRYVFKGDHNNFVDPDRPTRAQIVGRLWLHVPHAGALLGWLHVPLVAALLAGAAGLLLFGTDKDRRRRVRRRGAGDAPSHGGGHDVKRSRSGGDSVEIPWPVVACVTLAVVFAVLTVIAFSRAPTRERTRSIPYTQNVTFNYTSAVRPSPVYPSGLVRTGDPVFLQLVRRLHVGIRYRLASASQIAVTGTHSVDLELSEPDGWSSHFQVQRLERFTGNRFSTRFSVDLPNIQSLFAEVQRLTGVSGFGGAVAVRIALSIHGLVGGVPVVAAFGPALSFQLQPLQLQPNGVSTGSGAPTAGVYTAVRNGTATITSVAPNPFTVLGQTVTVRAARIISVVGLALALIALLVLAMLSRRPKPLTDEARIDAQYGQLIVPVTAFEGISSHPVDVTSIDALVRLAEHAGQLVLHQHNRSADSYLVNDSGIAYRYVIRHLNGSGATKPGRPDPPPKRNGTAGQAEAAQTPVANGSTGIHPTAAPAIPDPPPVPVDSADLPESVPVDSGDVPEPVPVDSGDVPESVPVDSGDVPESVPVDSGDVPESVPAAEEAPGPTEPDVTSETAQQEPTSPSASPPAAEVADPPAAEVTESPAAEETESPAAEVAESPAAEVAESPAAEVAESPAAEETEPPAAEETEPPAAEETEALAPASAPAQEPAAEVDSQPEPHEAQQETQEAPPEPHDAPPEQAVEAPPPAQEPVGGLGPGHRSLPPWPPELNRWRPGEASPAPGAPAPRPFASPDQPTGSVPSGPPSGARRTPAASPDSSLSDNIEAALQSVQAWRARMRRRFH